MTTTVIRTYSELLLFSTFEERYRYLRLSGKVGEDTFGFNRYLNQHFYRTTEWKRIRDSVIIRDNGCDLGVQDREIHGRILVHHMNPIDAGDIIHSSDFLINPEYLICVSLDTHNAIHYGDEYFLNGVNITERKPNDTCPWRK